MNGNAAKIPLGDTALPKAFILGISGSKISIVNTLSEDKKKKCNCNIKQSSFHIGRQASQSVYCFYERYEKLCLNCRTHGFTRWYRAINVCILKWTDVRTWGGPINSNLVKRATRASSQYCVARYTQTWTNQHLMSLKISKEKPLSVQKSRKSSTLKERSHLL